MNEQAKAFLRRLKGKEPTARLLCIHFECQATFRSMSDSEKVAFLRRLLRQVELHQWVDANKN